MAVKMIDNKHFTCLSTDVKPTIANSSLVEIGDICTETDTGIDYITYDGTNWVVYEKDQLTEAQINAQVDLALNTAIPASNVATSVNDQLLDVIPAAIAALPTDADVNTEVDNALNTAVPASNTVDSVNDILLDQVKPRLPGSGTIAISTDPASALAAVAFKRQAGVNQLFQKAITSAANTNGIVTIATITTAACLIKSIVVKAVTAAQTDLTSAAVKGGASQAITFISAVTAAQANITAIDQQVAWTGAVELAATKTIVMDVQGTGATPVNLLVTIEYEAAVDTGFLA